MNKNLIIAIIVAVIVVAGGLTVYHIHEKHAEEQRAKRKKQKQKLQKNMHVKKIRKIMSICYIMNIKKEAITPLFLLPLLFSKRTCLAKRKNEKPKITNGNFCPRLIPDFILFFLCHSAGLVRVSAESSVVWLKPLESLVPALRLRRPQEYSHFLLPNLFVAP